ncbi:MAG TPA: S8 family peptidase [Ideonella sp.]|uniref:S8 family peptidase n=1 Tax=Ideonella sp. TaxID=1929293 RepID=UPI002E34C5C6|nr:S8 family peptidase [Ideonella sp.]HEX5683446.1 S8 family peptidase [Ideonella sp.]
MNPIARRGVAVSGLLMAAALASVPAAYAGGSVDGVADEEAMAQAIAAHTDRLIIKFRPGSLAAQRGADTQALSRVHEAAQRSGVQMRYLRSNAFGAHVLKLDRLLNVDDAHALARAVAEADLDVEFAEPDRRMHAMLTPNDTSYNLQWHYYEATGGLNAPLAWDKSTGTGVVVAVLDTGYRPHADLAANILPGYDFIADTFVANDGNGRDSSALDPGDWVSANQCGGLHPARNSSWHGTHVAGTIAAVTNNASGVAGVAFGARIVPARVLGKCGGYTSDIADAITWASGGTVSGVPANANKARVINMSLGGSGSCASTTQAAINGARSRGTVVVVAAGNSNANAGNYSPASCAGVITVASVGRTGAKAYYSNYGAVVDLAAPGGDMSGSSANGVYSTLNTGLTSPGSDTFAYYQGTSMAAPHVAGAAALMLAKNSALTPDEVESKLKSTTRAFPGVCSQCGTGIVNASAAVDAAGGGGNVNEVESNNTLATAQVIAVNPATVAGNMGSTSDTDYFKVSVGAGKTLTSTLTPNINSDYDLYLYDAAGTLLASSIKGTGQVDTIVRTNGGSATSWYVRVYYYSGGTGATNGKYTLGLSQ